MDEKTGFAKTLESIGRYRLTLILGVITGIFFYVIITGLVKLSEKSPSVIISSAIAFQLVYTCISIAVTAAFTSMAKNLVLLAEEISGGIESRFSPSL